MQSDQFKFVEMPVGKEYRKLIFLTVLTTILSRPQKNQCPGFSILRCVALKELSSEESPKASRFRATRPTYEGLLLSPKSPVETTPAPVVK